MSTIKRDDVCGEEFEPREHTLYTVTIEARNGNHYFGSFEVAPGHKKCARKLVQEVIPSKVRDWLVKSLKLKGVVA